MGKLFVVGIGPGGEEDLTARARLAMDQSEILCGYKVYVELMRPLYPEKKFYASPMLGEMERCRWALEQAQKGRTVAMLCSGDPGVYGMAGPVLELSEEYPGADIEIVAGVSAALSGAAVLGAPLMNDFCAISLSDLLTPWEDIENRLRCAARGDFSICLYNPCSRKRPEHLRRACDILLEDLSAETVCGWVRNIGRDGQEIRILTLGQLRDEKLDMFTTVFIGASSTRRAGDRMVTPRGYRT